MAYTKEFSPTGDIVLVVGNPQRRYLVSSHFLIHGSPVFRAMLGPHFAEGQNLSSSDPKEVALEDDADYMEWLCAILHFKNNDVPAELSPAQVLAFAVMADKYSCVESVKLATIKWLLDASKSMSFDSLKVVLAAAFLLDDAGAFLQISQSLVWYVSIDALVRETSVESVLPSKVFSTSLVRGLSF